MPFYEYRPKSGDCEICDGSFVDLQKMSDSAHTACPDCDQACERVLSAPIVSVRGAEYRARENKEKRKSSYARASVENAQLRAASEKKFGQVAGHTHNCALAGCLESSGQADEAKEKRESHRFGGLPHLVGVTKK